MLMFVRLLLVFVEVLLLLLLFLFAVVLVAGFLLLFDVLVPSLLPLPLITVVLLFIMIILLASNWQYPFFSNVYPV